jgi:hypothetical protein
MHLFEKMYFSAVALLLSQTNSMLGDWGGGRNWSMGLCVFDRYYQMLDGTVFFNRYEEMLEKTGPMYGKNVT